MSKVIDLDSMYEPIELVIEGDKFVVKKLTSGIMAEASEIEKVEGAKFEDIKVDVFCLLTGADKKKVKADYDLRKIVKAITVISLSFFEEQKEETEKN